MEDRKSLDRNVNPNPGEVDKTDVEKLVERHMSDPNHIITDEELRSVRVGMTHPPDAPTEEAIRNAEKKVADHKADNEDDVTPGAQKLTPWDLLGP